VQVAFQGMAENDALGKAVDAHEALKFHGPCGQVVDGKDHVFDDDGASGLARPADRREKPAPDIPEFLEVRLLVHEQQRENRFNAGHPRECPFDGGQEPWFVRGPDLDQDGGHVFVQALQIGRHARLVLD